MSGRDNCQDNAVTESFFHALKTAHTFFECNESRQVGMSTILEYIEVSITVSVCT